MALAAGVPAMAEESFQVFLPTASNTRIFTPSPDLNVSLPSTPVTPSLSSPLSGSMMLNQFNDNSSWSEEQGEDGSAHPGLNQWNVGLPLVQQWGSDGSMTTLEFTPAIAFFTEDENPFKNDHLVREPLMRLGAHLSRDVIQGYLSLGVDLNYVHGGETQLQGVTQGARQSYRTVGVNASGQLTGQLGWSVEYSRAQSDEQGLEETDWYRLNLNYSF